VEKQTAKVSPVVRFLTPHPLRCDGKSAQLIDNKGDGVAPSRKRVRKRQKTKGLNEIEGGRVLG
jgi:hypothetical protein